MAHVKVIKDWKRLRFFPWVEVRRLGAFSSTLQNVSMDLVPFWNEYRWRPRK